MTLKWRLGMISTDRPYVHRTLKSLVASGILNFTRTWQLDLFCGSKNSSYLDPINKAYPWVKIHHDGRAYNYTANAVRCLDHIKSGCSYALYLEDDIVFCRNFMAWVDRFVDRHRKQASVFSFYTPYREVVDAAGKHEVFWRYPPRKFYGPLALAFKPWILHSFVAMARKCPLLGVGIDLNPKWGPHEGRCFDLRLARFFRLAEINVIASVPNVVQHIGVKPVLPVKKELRKCPGFIGENRSPL